MVTSGIELFAAPIGDIPVTVGAAALTDTTTNNSNSSITVNTDFINFVDVTLIT